MDSQSTFLLIQQVGTVIGVDRGGDLGSGGRLYWDEGVVQGEDVPMYQLILYN
jgi:hypothetical protein